MEDKDRSHIPWEIGLMEDKGRSHIPWCEVL